MKTSKAFDLIFGKANTSSFSRSKTKRPIRMGKTARDRANGHVAYQKNRRLWDRDGHVWYKA